MRTILACLILGASTWALGMPDPGSLRERPATLMIRTETGSIVSVSRALRDPWFDPADPCYEIHPLVSFTSDGASAVRNLPAGCYQLTARIQGSERTLVRLVELESDRLQRIALRPTAIVSIEGCVDPRNPDFRRGLTVGLRPPFLQSNSFDIAGAVHALRVPVADDGRFRFDRVAVSAGESLIPFVEFPMRILEGGCAELFTPFQFDAPIRIRSELADDTIQLPTAWMVCRSAVICCGLTLYSVEPTAPDAEVPPATIDRSGDASGIEVEP